MNNYEILYLFDLPASEPDLQAFTDRITAAITKEGGVIVYQENLGRRRLAFPINKITQGMYHVTEFDLAPENLKILDRALKLDRSVLRFQITSIKPRTEADRRQTLPESMTPKIERKPRSKTAEPKVAAPAAPALSSEELDKKLDELLKDDIIKE